MLNIKKLGKALMLTLCVTSVLFVLKAGFEEETCGNLSSAQIRQIRKLLSKEQKDLFCTSIAIKNLAGQDVQNALDVLNKQANELLAKASFLGLNDDPEAVVNN